MAAAEVSGTAALLLAENPAWPRSQVESSLEGCARLYGSQKYYGAGLLDASRRDLGRRLLTRRCR